MTHHSHISKDKGKEKKKNTLKATREKWHIIYRRKPIQMTVEFCQTFWKCRKKRTINTVIWEQNKRIWHLETYSERMSKENSLNGKEMIKKKKKGKLKISGRKKKTERLKK